MSVTAQDQIDACSGGAAKDNGIMSKQEFHLTFASAREGQREIF
jgi:hypothetical protein